MDKLLIPVLLLILLVGGFFLFFAPGKPVSPKIPPASSTSTGSSGDARPLDLDSVKTKANQAIDQGDFAQAIQVLSSVPNQGDADFHAVFGYAYSGSQDFPKAVGQFEAALAKKREPAWVYALAFLYDNLGDYARARPLYEELTKQQLPPEIQAKIFAGLGRAFRWSGDRRNALKAFLRAVKIAPKDDSSFIEIFKVLPTENLGVKWQDVCDIGDRYHAENFSYLFWKASFLQEIGESQAALEAFRASVAINPENPAPFFHMYNLLRKNRRIDEALAELEKFLRLQAPLPYIYFQAALDAKAEQRLDLAFQFLRRSILFDRSLLGRNDQGTIQAVSDHLKARGSPEQKQFMTVFNRFITGEFQAARSEMARLLTVLKDPLLREDGNRLIHECDRVIMGERAYQKYLADQRAAEQQQRAALQPAPAEPEPIPDTPAEELKRKALANPRDIRLQYLTAVRLAQVGDLAGSRKFLQETLRADPNVPEAHYSLARLALNDNDSPLAREHLEKALAIRPNHSQTRSFLATLYLTDGDTDKAALEARQALIANPANPEARLVLAEVYTRQNLPEKAREHIEIGLECEKSPAGIARLQELKARLTEK
jgi:tetratricopeptide (TPR) repeat protein